MFKQALALVAAIFAANSVAETTPITGTIQPKCVIVTDTVGVYGNPTPNVLTTAEASGGVDPIVRFDVISAGYYKAVISYPNTFSSSPVLEDVVNWTGDVTVAEVTDADMSAYDQNWISYNNVKEVDLSIAGSTWFNIESVANYGVDKSFPAGEYTAVVEAQCVAL